ncbi:MAG: polysaccharide deacetylase family protein [Candidatus Omnitrophica bacterium]|nr:polysaccharide deacetylase family protein [Candidatus Omnitrophota bacterium]
MPNILYHFVSDDETCAGIRLEDFRRQLDCVQSRFKKEDIVLTFDHGTIDHVEHVAPELERRGLRGSFFILTMVQEEYRVPTIDKQRWLEKELRFELARMVCKELGIQYTPHEAGDYLQEFRFYSPEERYLRYLRDQVIPPKVYERLIGVVFRKKFGNEKNFCVRHYLGWHHISHLHQRGHVIGSHSHYHYGDAQDFARSLGLLEGALGEKPRSVAYPNGWKRISDGELAALGIEIGYGSSEKGTYPYQVGRIDCKQLKIA